MYQAPHCEKTRPDVLQRGQATAMAAPVMAHGPDLTPKGA
jgi:hypothetical protein